MSLGKVKNRLIIMLLVANLVLAGLFAGRIWMDNRVERETKQQLTSLLAAQGVTVTDLPGEKIRVPTLQVARSPEAEMQAVQTLLGHALATDLGGGIVEYNSALGTAQFRLGGRFEIKLTDSTLGASKKLLPYSEQTLFNMGFKNLSVANVVTQLDSGQQLVVCGQNVWEYPLYNARAELLYSGSGQLEQVSGWWCFGTAVPESELLCKSAGTVLLQFSQFLEEPIEVQDIQLGYRIKASPPDSAILSPEWRIICADREYYLDAFTAALSSGE